MFSSNRAIEKSGRLANYQYIYREEYAALSREYMRDVAWNGIFDKKKKKENYQDVVENIAMAMQLK